MRKFLKIYGVLVAIGIVGLAVLLVVLGGVMMSGSEAENLGEAIGVTLVLIFGVVFIVFGIGLFIFAILFIISLGKRMKGKDSFIIDIILTVVTIVWAVIIIASSISQKETSTLAALITVVLMLLYAIPAIIDDKRLRKERLEAVSVEEEGAETSDNDSDKDEIIYEEIKH